MISDTDNGRLICLDTETTGLDSDAGDRITEIGLVEIVNRRTTGRTLQLFVDPEREVPEEAVEVHGMSRDDLIELSGGRTFSQRAPELMDFLSGSPLVIHNAPFDLGFLDTELTACGLAPLTGRNKIYDTLIAARSKHPGQRNNLDALARRYNVRHEDRTIHGALLDATILSGVYIEMTRTQNALFHNPHAHADKQMAAMPVARRPPLRYTAIAPNVSRSLPIFEVSANDRARHQSLYDRVLRPALGEDAPSWPIQHAH